MQSPNFDALVQPTESVRRVIWLAFIAAIVLYVNVAYLAIRRSTSGVEQLLSNPLTVPIAILALLSAVASRPITGMLLPDRQLRELLNREPDLSALARDPRTGKADADRLAKVSTLSPHEQRLLSAASSFFVPFLVSLAFNEAVALYGLVLAMLSHEPLAVWPFAIVAFALNLTVSPKLDSCFERATRLADSIVQADRK